MKVLVMGGTRFNGLALVQELVKWGHEVTVLNRGQSEARLPRAVRRLYADRTNHEQLREVLGPRGVRRRPGPVRLRAGRRAAAGRGLPRADRSLPVRQLDRHLRQAQGPADPRVRPGRPLGAADRVRAAEAQGRGVPVRPVPHERLPGHRGAAVDGARPEQHGRRPRAAHVPAAAARPPGAHPRRRHHAEPDRARRRRRGRHAHADDAAADLRQALQPHRPRLLERRGLRRHLRRDHRRHPAQGIRPGPGHGRHLRGQGRPVGGPQGRAGHEQGRRLRGRRHGQARPAGGGRARPHPEARAQHPPLERQHVLLGRAIVRGRRLPARVHLRGRRGAHLRLVPAREARRVAAVRLQLGRQPRRPPERGR